MISRRFIVPAVVTAAAGFGAMNLFWLAEEDQAEARGLYSYLASSVGDAVCLPVMAGAFQWARLTRPRTRRSKLAGIVAGALGAIGSAATQASWLADPDPDLNWTLPAAHTFNAAGWYHAAFSVGLAGFLGYQVGELTARLRQHGVVRETRTAMLIGAAGVGVFAVLLFIDNLPNLDRGASRASMVGLAAALGVTGAFAGWVLRQPMRD